MWNGSRWLLIASMASLAISVAATRPSAAQSELPPRCGEGGGPVCRVVRECTRTSCTILFTMYYPPS
jgi:hypothetical protein